MFANDMSRGGAKFKFTDLEGGQIFSAPTPRGGKISVRRNLRIPPPPRYTLIMTAPLTFYIDFNIFHLDRSVCIKNQILRMGSKFIA